MDRRIFFYGLLAAMVVLGRPGWAGAEIPSEMTVKPNQILMGATYNGQTVVVSGKIPSDNGVLIRVVGKQESLKFKKKGKALGLLWMNLDPVEFHRVPAMFLLVPSDELATMMSARAETWRKLGLGFDALKKDIQVLPEKEDKAALFDELVKLKKKQGLFGVQKKSITYHKEGSQNAFSASIRFPSGLPVGIYKIEAYLIEDDRVISVNSIEIQAKEVGMPAFLSSLAFRHSLLYGILAVLIAIFAGMLTGLLFRGGKGAH